MFEMIRFPFPSLTGKKGEVGLLKERIMKKPY